MIAQNKFCNKSLVFTLTFSFIFLLFISLVSSISWVDESQIIISNSYTGNLTNFSQMADSNTGNIAPNNGEGLTWSSSLMKWVATVLNSDLIWKKVGNVISPLNNSNLDMSAGGGNVTANYFFGDGSELTGINQTVIQETNISINYGANESSGNPIVYGLSTAGRQLISVASMNSGIWERTGTNITPANLGDNLDMSGGNVTTNNIFSTRINNSGEFRNSGRVIIGGEPTDIGILETSGVSISGGPLLINNSININGRPNGILLSVSEASTFAQVERRFTNSGSFFADESILCDSNDPFTLDDKFRGVILFNLSDFTLGFAAEITGFINSSCVVWKPQVRPDFTLTDIIPTSYILINFPIKVIYDNGAEISTHVGKNAKHSIFCKNNSAECFIIDFIGAENDQIVSQIKSDVNGFLGLTNFISSTKSSASLNFTTQTNMKTEADLSNYIGGEYIHYEISELTSGTNVTSVGIRFDSELDKFWQSFKERSLNKVWFKNSTNTFNITNEVNNSDTLTILFQENTSELYPGNQVNFTTISIVLSTFSGSSIDPKFYFCNSSGYTKFTVSDGTDGFQHSGQITFINPDNRGICNFDRDGTPFADPNNYTYITIERTAENIIGNIFPIARSITISSASSEFHIGGLEGSSGADNALIFHNKEQLVPGEPHTLFVYDDASGSTRAALWSTSRANETASGISNSFIIASDNDLIDKLNFTEMTNAVQRYFNYFGTTSPVDFDSSQNRTSAFVLYAFLTQQIHLTDALGNGLLSVFGDINFFLRDGERFDVVGDMNLRKTTIVPTGFSPGETVNLINENFEDGTLSPFVLLTDSIDSDEWNVRSDDLCFDGLCAIAGRIGTGARIATIIGINITTIPFDNLNLTFRVNTTNFNNDILNVTINNNTGSGDFQIFATVGVDANQFVNYSLDSNFNNLSVLTLKYHCSVNSNDEFCAVDDILLQGNATEDTTANVPRGDASFTCGFGEDCFNYEGPEVTGNSTLNITANTINLNGDVTLNGAGGFTTNGTCNFFSSPNGLGVLEVCNP